jgi:hypothetical protein
MTPLQQRMIEDMTVRGLVPSTQGAYLRAVRDLTAYYKRSPDTLSTRDIQRYLIMRSRTSGLRIMLRALSRSVCVMCISRSSARRTSFHERVQPSWAASEHTSAALPYDHQPAPCFRPSAVGATVAPERAILHAVSRHDRSSPRPSPVYTAATPSLSHGR